jgi:SAM-dependent methyltransferase
MGRAKPKGLSREYAEQFCDRAVVEAYECRPPYPKALVEVLVGLMGDGPRVVLDLGCGTGRVARAIVDQVERVDAVDFSQRMIEVGKTLDRGNDRSIRWICGAGEQVELEGGYGLVAAGSSLHWMDWDVVLPRIAQWLTLVGKLAIFDDGWEDLAWEGEVNALIPEYSTNREFEPYVLVDELVKRELFVVEGRKTVVGEWYEQSAAEYVEAFHGRNGFSRDRMDAGKGREFDERLRGIVEKNCGGKVRMKLRTEVVWGRPRGQTLPTVAAQRI